MKRMCATADASGVVGYGRFNSRGQFVMFDTSFAEIQNAAESLDNQARDKATKEAKEKCDQHLKKCESLEDCFAMSNPTDNSVFCHYANLRRIPGVIVVVSENGPIR